LREKMVIGLLIGCTSVSVLTMLVTIFMLLIESSRFFTGQQIELGRFFTDTRWTIGQSQNELRYGVLPLLTGTLRVAGIGLSFAIPVGIFSAVYLSEYASKEVRMLLKPALEILSGIPTVVLGFFAVTLLTPLVLSQWGDFKPFNAMSAGIAVGILCVPLVTSLVEDALQGVPRRLREGAYGMGATPWEVTWRVVLPAAMSGVISAILLAVARATGETMIVALAAGSTPTLSLDPRLPSQTMPGFILETIISDSVVPGTTTYHSIYAVAACLFLLTLVTSLTAEFFRHRFLKVH
jgi:phosphate transport system permease protein